nr:YoaK family protein [Vibrio agarilyticus]
MALLAGSVNAIGLLGFQHQAISHLSGTVTLMGSHLFDDLSTSFHLFLVIASFLLGSVFSGFFMEGTALKLGRRYGVALCIEGGLLLSAMYFINRDMLTGQYLASAACGLQNAMITTFSGAVVRTTHMTGVITDLGLMIGQTLRGYGFDKRKAKLFVCILVGFLFGGTLGAICYERYQANALVLPAILAFTMAIAYWLYLAITQPISKTMR